MRKLYSAVALAVLAVPAGAQDIATRTDSVLKAAESRGFSGVVRVRKDGRVVIEKGYGLANRAKRLAFTPSTVVQIGSNTKDFTAVAILQLKERGLLDLDDSLSKFFPSSPAEKRGITIRQLLDHTAGFPIGLGPDFDQVTRQQLIDAAMGFQLLFTPGERRNYSNTGYALLAAIIEQQSGKSYDEYVRDNVLQPLGLKDTGFHLPGFSGDRLAHGYRNNGEDVGTTVLRPHAPDGPFWNLRGNGGMLSTVSDMSRFYEALFESDKLLRPETRAIRFNPREPVALAGSDLVSSFLYERDPMARLEIIIASNTPQWRPPALRGAIASIMGIDGSGGEREVTGPQGDTRPLNGSPPAPAVEAIIRELVAVLNSGDRAAIRAFIAARFDTGDSQPTIDERLDRLAPVSGNLGKIEILGMIAPDTGPVRVSVRTAIEGRATLTVDIDRAAPHRIRRLGILVGGD